MRKACLVIVPALLTGTLFALAAQSVLLTSTTDFGKGNYEGLAFAQGGKFERDRISGADVNAWHFTRQVTPNRQGHTAFAYNGFLYALGGSAPDGQSVNYAPIAEDGTVGAFLATTSLPASRQGHFTVAYNGYAYVIGGRSSPSSTSESSMVAKLNADGTIGAWSFTEPLPAPRENGGAAVYNGHVYIVGGTSADAGETDSVLRSELKADGTLGAWTTATPLPAARSGHGTFAWNGYLYAVGGFISDEVLVAPLQADGSLGAWTQTTSMPEPRGFSPCVAALAGHVYVWQGFAGTFPISQKVMVAPLNGDGTVGAWSFAKPFPVVRLSGAAAVWHFRLYSVGGSDGSSGGEVVFAHPEPDETDAQQIPDRLKAYYSHLMDLQGEAADTRIRLSGLLSPGGRIRLQMRRAPESTHVFGPETIVESAPLDTDIPVPGHERFLWIRLTLDDSGTTDHVQRTTITDITVNRPPTANAGPDQTIECNSHHGAVVSLDGSGTVDPDGDFLQYLWRGPFGSASGVKPTVVLPLGTNDISLMVNDPHGATSSDAVRITVVDTTPPDVSKAVPSSTALWPPNRRMHAVTLNVSNVDACDAAPDGQILSVASNQPAGSESDWEITGDLSLNLRAERTSGKTRVYTITLRCTDASGNSSTGTVQVTVEK